jgi:AcrR family transcriptional regulator
MTAPDVVAAAAPFTEKKVLRKLKPGPGLSREAVTRDQKLRLGVAFSSLAAESGYDAVTVRALIGRACISTSTFYKLYAGVEECFAGVIGAATRGLVEEIGTVPATGGDIRAGLRGALGRLMEGLAREPEMAQAVIVEASAAGRRVHDEIEAALAEFEALLARALAVAPRPAVGTTHLAVGLVAGILRVIRKTTLTGRVADLPGLAPELTDWILSVAHEELIAFRAPRFTRPSAARPAPRIGSVPPSRELIADGSRRATMAAARLAATAGLNGLTSARIRKDAGLSRREFDHHFRGVEDCFLDAVEAISSMAADAADTAAVGAASWERHIYREVTALCALAAADPELSRLVLVEITAPGRTGLLRRERLISRGVAHLLAQASPERRPSELVVDASIAAVWRIAEIEVAAGRAAELPRIAPIFVYMILATRRPQAAPALAVASVRRDGAPRQHGRL